MFSSKEEFAKALIDGRRFVDTKGFVYYADWLDGGLVFKFCLPDCYGPVPLRDAWDIYNQVTEVTPWYKRIPEKGVLCWVWDETYEPKCAHVITRYAPGRAYLFVGSESAWKHATPLTLDEAKQLIVEATP